ncbi:MAG: P-II family nitrogen regulator [Candidatus Brocadiales bacterium]
MKKIEAIIRPDKLNIIKEFLSEKGYPGMTVTEVKGHGAQKGITEMWRGRTFKVDLLSKVKVEIVALDQHVDLIIQTIMKEARTGSIGDGKIFVSDIESVLRIRTGETGDKAV